jgi:hypothetical protein
VAWLVIGIPVALGVLLGSFVPTRKPVLLLLPSVAIGVAYWVAVGWNGDDYDIGREGLIVITGLIAGAFVALWTVGVALGRYVRATWRARATS